MTRIALVLATALAAARLLHAQTPLGGYADAFEMHAGAGTPDIRYVLHVDTVRGRLDVTMRVSRAPDTLRLAIPRWAPGAYRVVDFASRLRAVSIRTADGERAIADSGLGRGSVWPARGAPPLRIRGDSFEVRYEIIGDTAPNNRAFLGSSGALLDGPGTWLYIVGQTLAPARVRLETPASWRIVTGLMPTADSLEFFAPSYDVLVDSPVLMGDGRSLVLRRLAVDDVVHRVAWWRRPGAAAFDTALFVAPIAPIVQQTKRIFGWMPYREYAFLYVDGAGGGLEHLNSTTIGAPAAAFASDPASLVEVTAHEYFHHWNVKRVRPVALGPFDYQSITRSRSLWFSEGVTDYFANAMVRRAGLVQEDEARDALASSIEEYLANPASRWLSPERSSWTAWDPPVVNRGYSLSYYLSGALLGEILDVRLRGAAGQRGGMDALMRRLRDRYAGRRGFTEAELEQQAGAVCACSMRVFFQRYVAGGAMLPLDTLASRLGWRLVVTRSPATAPDGQLLPDRRIAVTPYGGMGSAGGPVGGALKLAISDPTSAWAKSGLASGDTLLAVNGAPVASPAAFRALVARLGIGDSVRVTVRRDAERVFVVHLAGYDALHARLEDLPTRSAAQRAARDHWLHGDR